MDILHEHHLEQSIPYVNATQFALLSLDRMIFLIERYEALRVDAENLPASPHRPPLPYVTHTLAELRRELRLREDEAVDA